MRPFPHFKGDFRTGMYVNKYYDPLLFLFPPHVCLFSVDIACLNFLCDFELSSFVVVVLLLAVPNRDVS